MARPVSRSRCCAERSSPRLRTVCGISSPTTLSTPNWTQLFWRVTKQTYKVCRNEEERFYPPPLCRASSPQRVQVSFARWADAPMRETRFFEGRMDQLRE